MKYLGVDVGTKKIGTAVSDDTGAIAFPLSVIPAGARAGSVIVALVREHSCDAVVLGHSQNFSGEDNVVMEEVRRIQRELEDAGITTHLEPEFLTTAQAQRATQGAMRDASAAALILQSFLDRV